MGLHIDTVELSSFLKYVLYRSSRKRKISEEHQKQIDLTADTNLPIDLTADANPPIDLTADVNPPIDLTDDANAKTSKDNDYNTLTHTKVSLDQQRTLAFLEGIPLHDSDVHGVLETFKSSRYVAFPLQTHFFCNVSIPAKDTGLQIRRLLNRTMFEKSDIPLTFAIVLNTVNDGTLGHFVVCVIQKIKNETSFEYFDSFGVDSFDETESNTATNAILQSVVPAYAWYCYRLTQETPKVIAIPTENKPEHDEYKLPISICKSQVQYDANMCGVWACWYVWQKLICNPTIEADAIKLSSQLGENTEGKQWDRINTPRSQLRQQFFERPKTKSHHTTQRKSIKTRNICIVSPR